MTRGVPGKRGRYTVLKGNGIAGRIARKTRLVIAGEYDQPMRKTQRPARELKNFTSVILPGKTHLTAVFPGYMPDLYIRSLVNFIDANDR